MNEKGEQVPARQRRPLHPGRACRLRLRRGFRDIYRGGRNGKRSPCQPSARPDRALRCRRGQPHPAEPPGFLPSPNKALPKSRRRLGSARLPSSPPPPRAGRPGLPPSPPRRQVAGAPSAPRKPRAGFSPLQRKRKEKGGKGRHRLLPRHRRAGRRGGTVPGGNDP